MSLKLLNVFAGPNGSGKSTLIGHLQTSGLQLGEYINADDIVKALGLIGDDGSRQGQLLADEARERCLINGSDFSFETVMSHPSKIEFMACAKSSGFQVSLFFVATNDPILNVERVGARVAQGGHDVPTDRIIARYQRTMALLPAAIAACNQATIFDNSRNASLGSGGLRPVYQVRNEHELLVVEFRPPVPVWALAALDFSETIWCFHKIFVNDAGVVVAHLIWKDDAIFDSSIGNAVPLSSLHSALEEGVPGDEIMLHPMK